MPDMRIAARLCLAAAVAVSLTSCGAAPPRTVRVNGLLTLSGIGNTTSSGDACTGSGGYNDIHGGAQVTVTDQAGVVVGVGQLGDGAAAGSPFSCTFMFAVASVPAGKQFYGVAVSHRGAVSYTEAQFMDVIQLVLGA